MVQPGANIFIVFGSLRRGIELFARNTLKTKQQLVERARVLILPQRPRRFGATLIHRPAGDYEPVEAVVQVGQRVAANSVVGRLAAGHPGCPAAACLHWGAMWGPAARADYVDPIGLLAATPVRLKPLHPR